MSSERTRGGSPRLWLVRILAVLLGVLGPLLALELGLRLFGPFLPGNYDTGAYLVRHAALGHFHVPGFDGWIKTSEFTTHVKISPSACGIGAPATTSRRACTGSCCSATRSSKRSRSRPRSRWPSASRRC